MFFVFFPFSQVEINKDRYKKIIDGIPLNVWFVEKNNDRTEKINRK